MAPCCASRDVRSMPGSPKPSKVSSPTSPKANRSCWRVTALKLGRSRRRWACGARRGSGRCSAQALAEAAEQFTPALNLIATLPSTSSVRREQIKLQVSLVTSLTHIKGWAAAETKAAVEQARLLLEQAEAVGDAPEDPLLLFSVPRTETRAPCPDRRSPRKSVHRHRRKPTGVAGASLH